MPFYLLLFFLSAQKTIACELIKAVKQNNAVLAETLVKQGTDVNCADENGATALMWAAYNGNFILFQQLIKAGADYHKQGVIYTDTTGGYYGSITGIAAAKNDTVLLLYCLDELKINPNEAEYNPQTKQNNGWMPLHWAAYNGSLEATKILVDHKGDMNAPSDGGYSPILYAALKGKRDLIAYFLDLPNININASSNEGFQLIHFICRDYDDPALIKKLISMGAFYNIETDVGYTPLSLAASNGNTASVLVLLEQYNKTDATSKIIEKAYDAAFENSKFYTAMVIQRWLNGYSKKSISELQDSLLMSDIFFHIGDSCKINQKFSCAIDNYEQGALYSKMIFGIKHPYYVFCLNRLARLYKQAGYDEKAEQLCKQAIQLIEELDTLYQNTRKYRVTILLYQDAIRVTKDVLGEKNVTHINCLRSLALIYKDTYNQYEYEQAFHLLQHVLQLRKEVFGVWNSDYADALKQLADLYSIYGSYQKALPLYMEALQVVKEISGEKNLTYVKIADNLAEMYVFMDEYENALSLYEQSLKMRKEITGETDIEYVRNLKQIASLYFIYLKRSDKAVSYYLEALKIYRGICKEDKDDLELMMPLAIIYSRTEQYEKALPLFEQILQMKKVTYGERYSSYISILLDVLECRFRLNSSDASIANDLLGAYPVYLEEIKNRGSLITSDNAQWVIKSYFNDIEILYSFAFSLKQKKLNKVGYAAALELKGMAFQNKKDLLTVLNQNTNKEYTGMINRYFDVYEKLNNLYRLSNTSSNEKLLDSLTSVFTSIERFLVKKLSGFKQLVQNRNVTWEQIQEKLKPGEAAVEFIEFRYWNKKWTDSSIYAAYVLFAKGEPQFVTLCTKKELEQKITEVQQKDQSYVKTLNQRKLRGSEATDESTTTELPDLYELVWKKLDSMLVNIRTVYYAPAGLLHRVNPAAVEYIPKKVLAEKYSFHLLASTRDIVNYEPQKFSTGKDSVLFYGGIVYDMDSSFAASQRKKFLPIEKNTEKQALRGSTAAFNWPALSGTEKEVNALETIAKQQKIGYSYYKGKEASEESFLYHTMNRPPAFIHIATHGFFYSDEVRQHAKDEEKEVPYFLSSPNAMYRSGLVFAGANRISMGMKPVKGIEDGIVTAGDIAGMNLHGTKLVVLSACETGLGKIDNTEGVFGLQRGIKLAGCKNLLMSLWKVPDEPTATFMEFFYTKLLVEKKTVYEAYQYAQHQMRKLYADDPFVWAAFVLME